MWLLWRRSLVGVVVVVVAIVVVVVVVVVCVCVCLCVRVQDVCATVFDVANVDVVGLPALVVCSVSLWCTQQ